MSYSTTALANDEEVIYRTPLHWIIYVRPVVLIPASALVAQAINLDNYEETPVATAVSALLFVVGVLMFVGALIEVWTTEIAVTNRRVILKRGLISRDTIEMALNRVEGVDVQQSIAGRLLGYGTINVHGTGAGIQRIKYVSDPIGLRRAAFSGTR
ncbi:MAG: PH domain-containing protein [Xanthobacteraceae bacterium]